MDFVRNGKYKNKQRYLCKSCNSTFNVNTNTAVHHIRDVERWQKIIDLMITSEKPPSLNKLAEDLNISSKTAHNWRHKFLSSIIELDTLQYKGELEVNVIYIPFWTKGKHDKRKTKEMRSSEIRHRKQNQYASFICIYAKNGDFDFFPVQIGADKIVQKSHLYKCLDQLNLPKETRITTKYRLDIWQYFKEHGYKSVTVDEAFNRWVKTFKGFSTKYIWNYLKWFKVRNLHQQGHDVDTLIRMSLKDSRGWLRFMMINHYYREFIVSK